MLFEQLLYIHENKEAPINVRSFRYETDDRHRLTKVFICPLLCCNVSFWS